MSTEETTNPDRTSASEPAPAAPAAVPAKVKRRHGTGVVVGAGLVGAVIGAFFTAGSAIFIWAFAFGPPPPTQFGPGASQLGFGPPGGPGGPAPRGGPMEGGPGGGGLGMMGPGAPVPGGPPPLGMARRRAGRACRPAAGRACRADAKPDAGNALADAH